MTVTIPDPSQLALPEFQPLWAWIAGAASAWYLMAAVLMRLTGRGKRIWEEAAERAVDTGWHEFKDEPPETWRWFVLERSPTPYIRTGEKTVRDDKNWNSTFPHGMFTGERWKYTGKPYSPASYVAVDLVMSPVDWLVFRPLILAYRTATLPFRVLLWIAKGSPKEPEPAKDGVLVGIPMQGLPVETVTGSGYNPPSLREHLVLASGSISTGLLSSGTFSSGVIGGGWIPPIIRSGGSTHL